VGREDISRKREVCRDGLPEHYLAAALSVLYLGLEPGGENDALTDRERVNEIGVVSFEVSVGAVGGNAERVPYTGSDAGRRELLLVVIVCELDPVLPPGQHLVRKVHSQEKLVDISPVHGPEDGVLG